MNVIKDLNSREKSREGSNLMENENYIKMILALPNEFFENWEFEDGDQVYLTEEIDDYSPSKDHGLYTVFDGLLAHDGILYTENWLSVRVIDFKNGWPIPSQERLQKMLLTQPHQNYEFNDLYGLVYWFNKWFFKSDELYCMSFHDECKDFGQAFLCFTVEVLYNMKWDGEMWVEE